MHSVFFRRLLVALIIAMLLTSTFMVAGYIFLSRDTYTKIKLEEMIPKAQAANQLVLEYRRGEVSDAAYERLSATLMRAASATTIVVDKNGNIDHLNNAISGLSSTSMLDALKNEIAQVLSGNLVRTDSIFIPNYGEVLAVGEPIVDDNDNIVGAILVVKSIQEIINATDKLSRSLFWIVAVVLPVIMILMTWRVRRITDPLHDMSEAAIEMSKGNFDIRVDEDTLGEVGVLARALNDLCETLSATIHQLRLEKGQLNEILQSLTDGVAATDSLGMLTHYNGALMRMFGAVNVEKREELISDSMVWAAFDEVFACGQPQTITYPTTGDRTIWITISPVYTDEGERTGVVGLFKDMTELERLENMRREYVANVSHELRTPLTAVRGLLEPLADGMVKDEADKQRYYKIMLHEVLRLSRLISDMMTLSRLQSGSEYIEYSRVNIGELIDDVAGGYTKTAAEKGIQLIVNVDDMPDALTAPDRVEQVLVILLDNAMHYTPKGGTITIRIRSGERLLVSVEDTGCGIPEADIPHIFERFYKVDKSRNEGGTGLGLSIAKYIMDKLEESLTVDSEPGRGTRFTFSVKKYVSNAIALGPISDDRQFGTYSDCPVQDETAITPKKRIVDAKYEVISEHKNDSTRKRKGGK
ncbi:MAG: ATP-binding protein [Clostridia bacterium]